MWNAPVFVVRTPFALIALPFASIFDLVRFAWALVLLIIGVIFMQVSIIIAILSNDKSFFRNILQGCDSDFLLLFEDSESRRLVRWWLVHEK